MAKIAKNSSKKGKARKKKAGLREVTRRLKSGRLDRSISERVDTGRLRDALEALEVLNRLERSGGAPPNSDGLRRRLHGIFDTFEAGSDGIRLVRRMSGAVWCSDFPDSGSTADLLAGFRGGVENFISAMRRGGASVRVSSTLRPRERAYLMHYAWRVARQEIAPRDVPAMSGVDIDWVHPTNDASRQAAQDMVNGYSLLAKPALTSRHTEGRAIDMTIGWTGSLTINDAAGTSTTITSTPRTGENSALATVGATYGVIKATFANDPPHWSNDGH